MLISDWSSDVCSSDLPEGEGDPASNVIRLERRGIDRVGPVGFRQFQALGAASVLHTSVKGHISADGLVVAAVRKRVGEGKGVGVGVDLGGRRILKQNRTSMNMAAIEISLKETC